jgi:SAM domain (Sterile alpha motif)
MQQIADWLEKLGLSEYAQRFAENRIDFSVLREPDDASGGIGQVVMGATWMVDAVPAVVRSLILVLFPS